MNQNEILKRLQKFPSKKLGQNFLRDEKVLADICEVAELRANDVIIEIGPGLGVLTEALCARVKKVIAIELDPDLATYLRNRNIANLTVICGNALDIDWTITLDEPYKIVANIPYSITSPLLRKIFNLSKKPESIVLLIQKEVALRLSAEPGNRDRGFLTLLTEANGNAKVIRTVKAGSFYPAPKVDSSVVKITPYEQSRVDELFWPVIEAGFSHQRQTAVNAIAHTLHLPKGVVECTIVEAELDPMVRPAMLTLSQWGIVSKTLEKTLRKA